MIRYFFGQDGHYLGGFDEGAIGLVPVGAIEVSSPPDSAQDRLVNGVITPVVQPLPERLLALLQSASAQVTADIEAGTFTPPPGVFAQIATLSTSLQELSRLVPESVYASEAALVITNLGVLPEPMETIRQQMLAEIQA